MTILADTAQQTASLVVIPIALPLLIRAAFTLGVAVTFETPRLGQALYIADIVIYGLCLIFILIGLISISIQASSSSDSRSVRSFDFENMHGMPRGPSNDTSDRILLAAKSTRYSSHPESTPKGLMGSDLYRDGKLSGAMKSRWPTRRTGAGGGRLGMLTF